MRQDSRLSRMLHVLLHMEEAKEPLTSEAIARMFNMNPVVVRRTLGDLRREGYVASARGHGGGWTLARPLSDISLLDVYRALGTPQLFALGLANDTPACLVEQAVNATLRDSLRQAEDALLARLGAVKLSEIATSFKARAAQHEHLDG